MVILFIGDVVGDNGIRLLRKALPELKRRYQADVTIVNGENSHRSGTGMTESEAQDIFLCGADVITGGNHSLRRSDISLYEEKENILCPQNFNISTKGCGVCHFDAGRYSICVVNMIGTAFIENYKNPFFEMDELLKDINEKVIFVDFHAESTAEKQAFAHYLDGRVSCVVGTHTHVQTNDECILPQGTGYITDAGCVCCDNSVLGVVPRLAIKKQKYLCPVKFEVMDGAGFVHGVAVTIDAKNGKTEKIEKFRTMFR